jgi:hypothetical protein
MFFNFLLIFSGRIKTNFNTPLHPQITAMNKYLLLRDNKQSGPYTVPEIIQMGIKPYDLVWLEGKSAAWRYPSEVEELKPYAPTVEEQPFDRFYKKADTIKSTPMVAAGPVDTTPVVNATVSLPKKELNASVPEEKHERYMPAAESDNEKPGRKVYINFPAVNTTSKVPADQPPANVNIMARQSSPSTIISQAVASPAVDAFRNEADAVAESWEEKRKSGLKTSGNFSSATADKRVAARSDSRVLQIVIAACIFLGLVSGVLLFNYFRQRQALNELNVLVQQIEKNKTQAAAVPASIIEQQTSASAPLPPATEGPNDKVVSDQQVADIDYNKPETQPSSTITKKQPAVEEQPVTFTENKQAGSGRPVARREEANTGASATDVSETLPSTENLFKLVEVKPNEYKTGLLGGISNLKFELINKSAVELHRVAVEIKYLGPEKKVVKKQLIYFENVSPGAQSTIEVPKSNRGVSIEYTITDIKS